MKRLNRYVFRKYIAETGDYEYLWADAMELPERPAAGFSLFTITKIV
jgi:hypothetical protein